MKQKSIILKHSGDIDLSLLFLYSKFMPVRDKEVPMYNFIGSWDHKADDFLLYDA
jgi:hypothetical protein